MARTRARTQHGTAEAGPPRLSLDLWRRLGLLALVNIIPIVGLTWLFFTWDGGPKLRPTLDPRTARVAVGIIAASALLVLTSWVVMPLARWLRDYPRWCFLHRSAALWLVPAVLGFLVWVALGLLAFAAIVASLVVLIAAFVRLLGH